MFFSSRACQIIAELGSGHFVRYCEINPDRDQDHQNTPRTLLQTDVLTGTFTFRKHFVFLVFILEICLKRPNFSEKIPFHNQSPGSEGGCQLYKLVSGIRLQLQDGNRWLKFLLRGYRDQSLSQHSVCKTTPDWGSIHFMSVYKFCCHA